MRLPGLFIICCLQAVCVLGQPVSEVDSLVKLYDNAGKVKGFATYRNGHLTGPYSYDDDGLTSRGNTAYNPSSITWVPLKKVTFILLSGDTATAFSDEEEYKKYFGDGANKVISTRDTMLPASKGFPHITLNIDEPGVIPTGHWIVFQTKSSRKIYETDYDSNGNVIKLVIYGEKYEILKTYTFPPCNKRKVMKYNNDGSFYDEICLDTIKK